MTAPSSTPLAGGAPPRFVPPPRPADAIPPEQGSVVLAACALGALAGLWITFHPPGLGLALIGVLTVVLAGWRASGRWRGACLIGAGALALTPLLRDATWVISIALLGGAALAAVGLAAGQSWRGVLVPVVQLPIDLLPASITLMLAGWKTATTARLGRIGPVARGLVIAAPLVLLFGALFASADAAFSSLVGELGRLDLGSLGITERVSVAVGVALIALALRFRGRAVIEPAAGTPTPLLTRVEWSIALGSLVLLFALFVGLQLRALFGGDDYVQRAAGLTYAQYARQGFGQLTMVAALTLGVLAAVGARGPATDRIVRGLGAALCALTLVIVASAWHRLSLYEAAFGATRLRLLTQFGLLWFAGVFAAILAAGGLRRGAALPRVVVALSTVLLLGFVAADPDRRIAQTNVDRALRTGAIDRSYLAGLSADAAPELVRLPRVAGDCLTTGLVMRDGSLAAVNLSRRRANRLAETTPPGLGCRP